MGAWGDRGTRVERHATRADAEVVAALRSQLAPEEILLEAVRITDPRGGDVEIDVLVLFPDLGAAVIEVKGGRVDYRDGQWTTTRGRYSRRIHPIDQARRGKHALRRYLDRQPEWQGPLLRTEWFVTLPHTTVTSDLGPEGVIDQVIGDERLPHLRSALRQRLASTLNTDPLPRPGWHEDVLTMLLRSRPAGPKASRSRRTTLALTAVATTAVIAGGIVWLSDATTDDARADVPGQCQPGYDPCLPVVDDLDCSDVREVVMVSGDDPYDLDRNGDGIGCEVYQ